MRPSLARSYRYCEDLTRRQAGNFYPAFLVLPRRQRLAMCALYAFMRIADDISDEPAPVTRKSAQLDLWRRDFHEALRGVYSHPGHEALRHTLETYRIPHEYLEAVLDGVAMDLAPATFATFATFAELRHYCYNVASAVGLASIHVWGFKGEAAKDYAEKAGLAFQLTNILRDLKEDAERGRIYLPSEELERFGYPAAALMRGERNDAFHALMKFQVERARRLYQESWPLTRRLSPAGRAVFVMMAKTYRRLLDEIERCGYDVFTNRVRVDRWRKLLFAAEALPMRWELW